MTDSELGPFVDHARDKGLDYATIRHLLLSAGWKDKDIAAVISARALEVPIPIPAGMAAAISPIPSRPTSRRKARDAFRHLLVFGSLYAWATSLILLLFTYIDFAFPDPAWRVSHAAKQAALSAVRAELAVLIVAFPVFILVWNSLLREVRRHSETAQGVLRRWLGYLSLFVGVITLSGDAMTLIYYLLEGQLTVRFVLKAAALFVIAGGLVTYLGVTLRREAHGASMTTNVHAVFSVVTSLAITAIVVWGAFLVGSPATVRTQRFDQQRLADLQTISHEIQSLCHDPDIKQKLKRPLPESLEQLAAAARSAKVNLADPETGEPYAYTVKDSTTYELCATFSLKRDSDVTVFWNHEPGRHCFTIDALDPP